ncbi:MAG: hypothetical protein D6675_14130 [Gemmatimonadetes bacterium]|nr:MAG: hypothetical protein D6675_14130 [Gemmatimonadota bacterium]
MITRITLLLSLFAISFGWQGCGATSPVAITPETDCITAIQYYTRRIHSSPQLTPDVLIAKKNRSRCYMQLADDYFARQDYSTAMNLYYFANTDAADEQIGECLWQIATKAYEAHHLEVAATHLNTLIADYSHTTRITDGYCLKIQLLMAQDKREKAQQVLQQVRQQYPQAECLKHMAFVPESDVQEAISRARQQIARGDFTKAIDLLKPLLETVGDTQYEIRHLSATAYLERGNRYLESGELEPALADYQQAKRIDSTLEQNTQKRTNTVLQQLMHHAKTYDQRRQVEAAAAIYQTILQYEPDHSLAQHYLAHVSQRRHQIAVADSLIAQANALMQRQQYTAAKDAARRALTHDPTATAAQTIIDQINIREYHQPNRPEDQAIRQVQQYQNGKIQHAIAQQSGKKRWRSYRLQLHVYHVECQIDLPHQKPRIYEWSVDTQANKIIPLNEITEKITYQ